MRPEERPVKSCTEDFAFSMPHMTADSLVVAGGVIPPDHYQFLKDAGCFDVYGPGTKIPVAAKGIIERLMR